MIVSQFDISKEQTAEDLNLKESLWGRRRSQNQKELYLKKALLYSLSKQYRSSCAQACKNELLSRVSFQARFGLVLNKMEKS